mmetsp:Transcript_15565/g.26477  ORF Transcript_15565/g.26477 Transcript_15565/m.26477 type:complete len:388 (-) Transcript_15565:55-1218(-)
MHATSFEDLLLSAPLTRAISDRGFEHPSEVQNQCIPQAILGTDVLCQAKSGMGKTAVFVISVLEQLKDNTTEGVVCLCIAHTRELAHQIHLEFERFKRHMENINVGVFYGGVPIAKDRETLKNPPQIVIGTPGRILKLVKDGDLNLKNLKHFVLDECDRCLASLDMRRDVQSIFQKTPHSKQVMMFSATLSDEIKPVCKKFMRNPLEVIVTDNSKLTLHGLQQYYVSLVEKEKVKKLFNILDAVEFNQVVIFTRTVERADLLRNLLVDGNFPATVIHARLQQAERIARFEEIKNFKKRILVTTDLFARGVDVSKINVVLNFDMPQDADSYLHRVGRAGRFGTKGLAISFVSSEEDAEVLNAVQKRFVISIPTMPDEIDCSVYMSVNK